MSSMGSGAAAAAAGGSIYNTREPVQALANMESMTIEAVFILKDFHRHMDDPVGRAPAARRRPEILCEPPDRDHHRARARRSRGADYAGRILRSPAARPRTLARYRPRHVYAAVEDLHT